MQRLSFTPTELLHRKRLRQANDALQARVREVVGGQVRDTGRILTQNHAGLCKAMAAFQDICRNIKVANEELTECSVELMDAGKRLPPFFSAGKSLSRGVAGHLKGIERWELLAGAPSYQRFGRAAGSA